MSSLTAPQVTKLEADLRAFGADLDTLTSNLSHALKAKRDPEPFIAALTNAAAAMKIANLNAKLDADGPSVARIEVPATPGSAPRPNPAPSTKRAD